MPNCCAFFIDSHPLLIGDWFVQIVFFSLACKYLLAQVVVVVVAWLRDVRMDVFFKSGGIKRKKATVFSDDRSVLFCRDIFCLHLLVLKLHVFLCLDFLTSLDRLSERCHV